MNHDDPLLEALRHTSAGLVDCRCQIQSLRLLFLETIRQTEPDLRVHGLPPKEWLQKARVLQMEKELARLADEHAGHASHVQAILTRLRKREDDDEV